MKANELKNLLRISGKTLNAYAMDGKIGYVVIPNNKYNDNDGNVYRILNNDIKGKNNNQNFVQLTFNMLINQIYYKAREYKINLIIHDESYTSKCSFIDKETMEKHEMYLGKRIKREIFRSLNGILIHADLHASYNIIKKQSLKHLMRSRALGCIQEV
ncbi:MULTISPECIES: IS200/IS605 family accessory protein TnpB-related protein [Acidiplasma]|jgi:putative transposase|uniref:zinc ribbon domain-containing protein n=1 Tax=Acidiplasma TaxID=507753 RepID=UPI000696DBCF|nr:MULTISPECIES: IS200/IS605 family accessory protein TnpB-related protein [unclassified Acidiplasma]WMT55454.1 MAG: zinc ribbon domain-containing protein [Acidiplasma sp.]